MIYATLEQSARYEVLHPLFKPAFEYLKTHDLHSLEPQTITIQGEEIYASLMEFSSHPQDEQPLEAHDRHIDIQLLLSGRERIGWRSRSICHDISIPYDAEKDILFFRERPTSFVDLLPGDFVILYPEDAHAPMIGDGSEIRKIIVKIKL